MQRLPEFYLAQLGHLPEQVVCQITGNQVVITISGALTQLEKLLHANNQPSLVQNLRAELDHVLQAKLRAWIEELLQTQVTDLLGNTDVAQDRMMVIAILSQAFNAEAGERSQTT